jgi:microcystin-dependent protein
VINMTITYGLLPVPKWYIADLVGRPLAGGYLATFSSLDHTQLNPVFQDPAGLFPWPYVTIPNIGSQGILFDENGAQGPFYFSFDSATPAQLYYLEVYDANGVLQWTIDNFTGNTGSGGSVITTALDLENLIVNNVMWRNFGQSAKPIINTFLKIAPSAHASLPQTPSNAGADVCFIKNNISAADQLTFVKFPLGSTPLTGDITPVDYLNYECTNTPTGETQKCVQFPITHSVQNLTNQNVMVTIWAKGNSGTQTLTLQWRQFFGDGPSASPDAIHPIQTITLSNSWQKFVISDSIPSVLTAPPKVLGECGNDGLFLQVQYPLDAACSIDFTKPAVYLGNVAPAEDYHSYDMIDGIINAQRTGFVMTGFEATVPPGYIIMDDGTIGSATSGATTRANIDTFPLYNLLWNNVSNAFAPVSTGRGVSAIADFTANKTLGLTKTLGRALGSKGLASGGAATSTWEMGENTGFQSVTLNATQIPSLNVTGSVDVHGSVVATTPGNTINFNASTPNTKTETFSFTATANPVGGGQPHDNMQPSTFMNFFIKL